MPAPNAIERNKLANLTGTPRARDATEAVLDWPQGATAK